MATSQRAPITNESLQCPIGGASETKGGCREVGKCIAAPVAMEKELAWETVAVLRSESMSRDVRILEAGFGALSLLHIGLLLCAADGRVIGANEIAEEILSTRDGLEMTREGVLRASKKGERSLEQLLQQMGKRTRDADPVSNVLAVPRGARKRPLTLFIRTSHLTAAASEAEPSVLIMIVDSALPVRAIESELRQIYGFSSMEARLANLLMQGHELEESCRELAIRRSTGCTHLKRLFKKAGVHRQSELVALLLKSIGLACLGDSNRKRGYAESLPTEDTAAQRVGRFQTAF